MRYFFNVIKAGVEIRDLEGTDLPDEDAAHKEAAAICADLAKHYAELQILVLEVVSETGKRLLALPVSKVEQNIGMASTI